MAFTIACNCSNKPTTNANAYSIPEIACHGNGHFNDVMYLLRGIVQSHVWRNYPEFGIRDTHERAHALVNHHILCDNISESDSPKELVIFRCQDHSVCGRKYATQEILENFQVEN